MSDVDELLRQSSQLMEAIKESKEVLSQMEYQRKEIIKVIDKLKDKVDEEEHRIDETVADVGAKYLMMRESFLKMADRVDSFMCLLEEKNG